nr:MAG TPA: hypothetical protein [Caudoviricetes sp.]DAY40350.1 MAG TPA: hypothetical protein [Caudoviricetes sp.]
MSPKPGTYSLTSPNAVYANRALNHAYWALGATIFVMVLHTLTSADGLLDLVWGAWMIFEFSQIIRYGVKSIKAGIRDGRVLAISIREGALVSIPEDAAL